MKTTVSVDPSRLTTCFRAGLSAFQMTCSLTDVANMIRCGGDDKALKSDGLRALMKAAAEAERFQTIMPEAKKAAAIVARKAERWAKELEDKKLEVTRPLLKKFQERFSVLSKDVARIYSDSLKACGKDVSPDNVVYYLYPERKPKQ